MLRHLLLASTENDDYQQILQQSSIGCRLFARYRDNSDDVQKICTWLQHEQIQEFDDWAMDKLLRDLFWHNLLIQKKGQFTWRCKIIRKMGKKVLGC